MQNVIELLRRWAELEPERCEPAGGTDFTVRLDNQTHWIPVHPTCGLYKTDTALLGLVIEEAIIEREDWQLELKGDYETWTVRIWVRSVTRPVSAPTKLEALLTAYLTALGAKDSQ